MWLLTLLCTFISVLFASSCADTTVFRKCCPEEQSLIKVSNYSDPDKFLCVNGENAKLEYNINKLPRIIVLGNVTINDGIPSNCSDLQFIAINDFKFQLKSKDDTCYDKMVAEILNGTTKNLPKTVALVCSETENKTKPMVEINHIRKCCPEGQAYDTRHHQCRDVLEKSTVDGLLKWLHVNQDAVYDMDVGLRCKNEEFAVELVEGDFNIALHGSVLDISGSKGGGRVPSGEWCLDREFSGPMLVARVCTSNCAQYGAYCLRKCCPLGYHYKPSRSCSSFVSSCEPDNDVVLFETDSYLQDLKNDYDHALDVIGVGIGIKCTAGKFGLNKSSERDSHWLTRDGKLVGKEFEYSLYCLETFDWRECPQKSFEVTTLACFVPDVSKNFKFSAVTNIMSAIFLLITVIVYCCLPELQNLHGRTVICHASTMLVAYSCLARVQFDKVNDLVLCKFLGYGIYFGFVAAFFWLNVMCFDIWWTFG